MSSFCLYEDEFHDSLSNKDWEAAQMCCEQMKLSKMNTQEQLEYKKCQAIMDQHIKDALFQQNNKDNVAKQQQPLGIYEESTKILHDTRRQLYETLNVGEDTLVRLKDQRTTLQANIDKTNHINQDLTHSKTLLHKLTSWWKT